MRQNRRDPKDPIHTAIHLDPERYTRSSRRAAGHRGAVRPTIAQVNADKIIWSRRVRRAAVFLAGGRTKSKRARARQRVVLDAVKARFPS